MSHDPHFGFVLAAYALAVFVIGAMIAAVLLDSFRLKRALSSFASLPARENAQERPAPEQATPEASSSEG